MKRQGIRRGFAVAAVVGFATVASMTAASAMTVKDLQDKGYSCGKAGVDFTSCTKKIDGKDSEYYCSSGGCEHVSGPVATRRAPGHVVLRPGTVGPVK